MSAASHYPLAIIGAGALGLHFAARLAAVGPLALVVRSAGRAALLRGGVHVGETFFVPHVFAPDALPTADWVILLVKTGDIGEAARTACAMHPAGVLSLQNGLVEDLLRKACGAVPVGQGITTEGAFREGERVYPSGAGETLLPPGFEAVAALLGAAGFAAWVAPDIAAARLAKLLVNVAINPLAALFRVPNGALLEAPHRRLLEALVAEAWPVLQAAGLQLDEAAALARVLAVARATAGNRASMLQDVLAARRTEIDAITGTLLAMGDAQGRALPMHRAVHTLVKQLEGGR